MAGLDLENVSFLVADDNGFMRQTTRAILKALGVKTMEEAADGARPSTTTRGRNAAKATHLSKATRRLQARGA